MLDITKLFKPVTVYEFLETLNPNTTIQIYSIESEEVLLDGTIEEYFAGNFDTDKEACYCPVDDKEAKEIRIGDQIDIIIGV